MSLRVPLPSRLRALLLLLPLALLASPAGARSASAPVTGVVRHVTDGDTLWLRPTGGGPNLQVRLQSLDAPEICQAHGSQARDALAAHVQHRTVQVHVRARDVYQRTIARITLDGRDVGAQLVADGHAWSTHYQRRAGPYAAQEQQARSARLGLWAAAAPVEPKAFRKRHGSCHPQGGHPAR